MLSDSDLKKALSITDLTIFESGPNPINLILKEIVDSLAKQGEWPKPEVRRGNPVVTVEENFDLLLIPKTDICRLPVYTRYVDDSHVLRTQASSMIPSLLQERPVPDDRILVCPGIVYRRDVIDKLHSGTHHQMDVWRVKKGKPDMNRGDLIKLIDVIIGSVFPGAKYRVNEKTHPYTSHGVEIEVFYKDKWVETLEGGEISPEFFEQIGIDPNEYTGLATGFGLDRLAMMVKDMDDIRLFRATDQRIVKQMKNLEPYKAVSKMPSMIRDISVVVDASLCEEDICEKIRSIDQKMVDVIEEIQIKNETMVSDLPQVARERLGASDGQKNLLIRIILCALDRTLCREEADKIRNAAYLAVHESDVKVLIDDK